MFYWVLIKNDHFSCAGKRICQKQVQVKENSFLLQIFRARIFYAHCNVSSLPKISWNWANFCMARDVTIKKTPLTARIPKSVMHLCCFPFIWNDTTCKTTSKSWNEKFCFFENTHLLQLLEHLEVLWMHFSLHYIISLFSIESKYGQFMDHRLSISL